ncbi:MAG: methyltransferase domain-containing protein [Planctomycetota bacterium]|nr:MAG: methyltransferase domain-containing protein [Planctomycetota bacterium]
MNPNDIPDWLLPEGTSRSTWQWMTSGAVADSHDRGLLGSPMEALELRLLRDVFPTPRRIVDLGCGSGRLCKPLLDAGHCVVGIDLSPSMLSVAAQRLGTQPDRLQLIRGSLVSLNYLRPETFDGALCMASTLGMISSRSLRVRALANMSRLLTHEGTLLVHVHRFWHLLRMSGGRTRLAASLLRSCLGQTEFFDCTSGTPDVCRFPLHLYSAGELKRDCAAAGLVISSWTAVGPVDMSVESLQRYAFRSPSKSRTAIWQPIVGWIVECRRSSRSISSF